MYESHVTYDRVMSQINEVCHKQIRSTQKKSEDSLDAQTTHKRIHILTHTRTRLINTFNPYKKFDPHKPSRTHAHAHAYAHAHAHAYAHAHAHTHMHTHMRMH